MQITIVALVFGLLMIIINSVSQWCFWRSHAYHIYLYKSNPLAQTGIIVIWGKTADQDDDTCDSCEIAASTTGWCIVRQQ